MKKECGSMSEKSRKALKLTEEEGFDVCSATDCTGLIPAGPASEEELEQYEELYPFLPKTILGKRE